MLQDATVQVAAIGIVTTMITTAGVVIAAVVTNKHERMNAAIGGIESILRERLAFRDEQIREFKDAISEKDAQISALQRKVDKLKKKIDEMEGDEGAVER